MAAISTLENANLVRQKVKAALMNATPWIQEQFKDFMIYLATQKGNPDLQFTSFQANGATAGGVVVRSTNAESGSILAVYLKHQASGTDEWFKLYDDNTDDTTAGDALIAIPLHLSSQYHAQFYENGVPYTDGLVITGHTSLIGTTDGATTADGFVILGA